MSTVAQKKTSEPAPAEARPAGSAPRVAAVIDVGSTAIRMEVAELAPDGTMRVLDSLQQPVHLGKDSFTKGRILQSTLEECVKILKGYRRVMQEYGVTDVDGSVIASARASRGAPIWKPISEVSYLGK